MNPFVFSCICPHGGEIIPELQGTNPKRMAITRESLSRLGKEMEGAKPDVLIVLTPHGTRINGQFSISGSERMVGTVEENEASFTMGKLVDRDLAQSIAEIAIEAGIPVGTINFGTSAGPFSCLPLDWGAIVPLRFMPNVPIVVITPSRDLSFGKHVEFGKAIRDTVQKSSKRIGLIASCDWSHAHDEKGPYGFDPAAKKLDEEVVELIKDNQLEKMANFDADFIEAAKPDGIWQTLILAGAISPEERQVGYLSYEAPTYFGLICAAIR
ncbi:extradiol ring-cleavage dioxygenase [Lederbergia wuyishanensis]|uniref:Aromatic ring-opening dioxygenase LigB subunit n=1 Tax=Lederbergia wuyishanensis TaxID=1347903 RepID=A0ABU0D7W7_9BACI|nr:extradiol ring-cleavage dioxygenase [Lederbergia wuyishanensis]MCJ8009346.1 extradiol ring-cleavage dioxygenase [Lederbergia wuyishanensis]MDQ0344519.1 aromatic ring-opening dioxygenase LigB subunit [Lederbergia wuyishanensis]